MAKRVKSSESLSGGGDLPVGELRHSGAKRKNNPPAKIAAEGTTPIQPKAVYSYNPHLPPVLRFDQHGKADTLETRLSEKAQARAEELLGSAQKRALKPDEAAELQKLLHDAAHARVAAEPWLEWTGKRERPGFAVDPVALHIHERVSAQAILKVAARQDVDKFLFADPEQEYHQAVQFYKHDVEWSNRLILGDSLQVMSSLAKREDLAGKVQMIYMDPPYGIRFGSNFQTEVGKREVKDKQEDLTREAEMIRAYRDTWHLGIHSYLSYLRDRLVVARELLTDRGSIFVQISDENLHIVRNLLDEVFGQSNFCSVITVRKTAGANSPTAKVNVLGTVSDYLIWYCRDSDNIKYNQLFADKESGGNAGGMYQHYETASGERRILGKESAPENAKVFRQDNLTSAGWSEGLSQPIEFSGREFSLSSNLHWKTTKSGLARLMEAQRCAIVGNSLAYIRRLDDFPVVPRQNLWTDTATGGFGDSKVYVVQTVAKVIERCMLMTTDPGDLVLDPTCGSGTTASVAEQWGRRWITCDTSRVAVAIARQRLLTGKHENYKLRTLKGEDQQRNPDGTWLRTFSATELGGAMPMTFHCKTVPHVTLRSIAQNVALDPLFAKHEPLLDAALQKANGELSSAIKNDETLAAKLSTKLARKENDEGKRAVTDADKRRWVLPPQNRDKEIEWTVDAKFAGWYHWEMPFDADPDWPKGLQDAVTAYREAWRAKMDEVNACIAASAEQEELVDQPLPGEKVNGKPVVRVSGPFTVEAVQPPEMSFGDVAASTLDEGFAGSPEELASFVKDGVRTSRVVEPRNELEVANVGAYLDSMLRFLRVDGVRFLNNKPVKWVRLEPLFESGKAGVFHAEGRWTQVGESPSKDDDGPNNVGVIIGPQYGPVSAKMVEEAIRQANRAGYDHLVVAGFSFDGAATAIISENADGVAGKGGHVLRVHLAHIRPDINPGMEGLLKESPQAGAGQLFTVFGQPRIKVESVGEDGKKSKDTGRKPGATKEAGMYTVTMEGVDIYNPVDDSITSSGAGKVAAWFLDSDYDGRTFCITQAFFPDRSAWEKLQKALNGKDGPIDAERFEALSGTTSLAFPAGKHGTIAVKVIDPRGNEVMAVEKLK